MCKKKRVKPAPSLALGDEIVIDAFNADSYAYIIGRPLAEAIKKATFNDSKGRFVITSITASIVTEE